MLAREEWKFPILSAIIQAPTLRPDGSILQKPGYDEETGIYFDSGDINFPEILENPNKEDAINSLDEIKKILKEFPFVDGASESVCISAMLTVVFRKSLRSAPGIGFNAPKMGSGKTLLSDLCALIATGKNSSKISQSKTIEEERKTLLAILMEGDSVITIDNISFPLYSDSLCTILTEPEWKARFLGQNLMVAVPTCTNWMATGNNLTFRGDLSTRFLLCSIDPKVEKPEERDFKIKDIRSHVKENRGDIVKNLITILRAYFYANLPKEKNYKTFGRFEEWSDVVRGALIWLKEVDPCKTREKIEENDPVRENLKMIFSGWYKAFEDKALKIKDVVEEAKNNNDLKDSIEPLAIAKNGEISTRVLSNNLKKYKNRIEFGYKLEDAGKANNYVLWKVIKVVSTDELSGPDKVSESNESNESVSQQEGKTSIFLENSIF